MKTPTQWNLNQLYKGDNDPKIEKDIKAIESACSAFERKYKKADFTSSPTKLAKALKDYEQLKTILTNQNPWWYFALRSDLNSSDDTATAAATKINQRYTKTTNKITFFSLKLGKVAKADQKKLLNDPLLAPYRYFLTLKFKQGSHQLSEAEEQLLNLLTDTSYSMWVDGNRKLLSKQTIKYKNKELPIAEAISILSDLPDADRQQIQQAINAKLKYISHFAESELNAVYNYKKVDDELRKYERPYSATIEDYENDQKTVDLLIKLTTKNFRISHQFFKIHAKLLKKKNLTNADHNTKIGGIKRKFDFNSTTALVKRSFANLDPQYAEVLDNFLANGQIDVYPKKGKGGGAYCWGNGDLPTFVLLNHTDDIRSVETLAHEMGHAIHTELGKNQTTLYRGHSTATAEVASTLFEHVLSAEIEKTLTKDEQIILLHNRLLGDISTIFRQIAFFNFELELHEKIRNEGQVSGDVMAELLSKHLKSYMGPTVKITPDDGYFFTYISQIRRFFYVYSYAYGQLISRALFNNWQKDPSYASKIRQFLSAGRSMSPADIFKQIGINTSDPKFFESALASVEQDVIKLEKLSRTK